MGFIYLLILLLVLFVLYIITQTLRIHLLMNLDQEGVYFSLVCLYPLFKAEIIIENNTPYLLIYLLKMKIYKSKLKLRKSQNKRINLVKIADTTHVNVTTHYGFKDPFTTALVYGALGIASQYINVESVTQIPDFVSGNNYLLVNADANINLGHFLMNYIKNKRSQGGIKQWNKT